MSRPRGLVLRIGDRVPHIHPSVFIAPGAVVAGDVRIGAESSVWPGCVLRGDYGSIVIGERTNIQDGTVIHSTDELPSIIGDEVVVGHGARLEGCVIEDRALIGMGSILLHHVRVCRGGQTGAGAVLSPRTLVPPGALALGVPARIKEEDEAVRAAREDLNLLAARLYMGNARRWAEAAEEVPGPDGAG